MFFIKSFLNLIMMSFISGQFAMTLVFPPLLGSSLHPGWIFFMFFVMSMLALVFVSVVIVETKGKQPKEILQSWRL